MTIMDGGVDILMITHNRPAYTRMALPRLLETCDESMRVWVWHNGGEGEANAETLRIVESMREHPRLYRFHHSEVNRKLTEPTNWLWSQARGELLGKVDDDVLVPADWSEAIRRALCDDRRLGAVSCWSYGLEDFDASLAERNVRVVRGGHKLLMNSWIGGTTYLMKRRCVLSHGLLPGEESFPVYTRRLAWSGWINGWLYPPVFVDHMDDPRSPNTLLGSDDDLVRSGPLTPVRNGMRTLGEWQQAITDSAICVQSGRTRPGRLFWLRTWPHRVRERIRRAKAGANGWHGGNGDG